MLGPAVGFPGRLWASGTWCVAATCSRSFYGDSDSRPALCTDHSHQWHKVNKHVLFEHVFFFLKLCYPIRKAIDCSIENTEAHKPTSLCTPGSRSLRGAFPQLRRDQRALDWGRDWWGCGVGVGVWVKGL